MPDFGNSSNIGSYIDSTHNGDKTLAGILTAPADGWITDVHVHANGWGGSVEYRLGLWDAALTRIFNGPLANMGTSPAWRSASCSERVNAGDTIWAGILGKLGDSMDFQTRIKTGFPNERREQSPTTSLPNPLAGTLRDFRKACYCTYVAQVAPTAGVFQSPTPAEGAIVTDSTPTIKGTTPHGNGDDAYDETNTVQLQAWNTDDPAEVYYDQQFSTTATEKTNKNFSKDLTALSPGANVTVRFRHQDTWGAWSPWSAERNFQVSAGPDPPGVTRQVGKINWRNETEWLAAGNAGPLYAGTYNNAGGQAMFAVRLQLWNRAHTVRVADTGWISKTATGGVWTVNQSDFPASGSGVVPHPATLDWGTEYSLKAAAQEEQSPGVGGVQSDFGDWTDFNTNSVPDKPENMTPAGGIATQTLQFSATAADPDGDLITAAQIKIVNMGTNITVTGYPKAMTISGNSLSFTVPGGDIGPGLIELGQEYKWQARASDATGYGEWSDYEQFVYAAVPTVDVLAPTVLERRNLLQDPGAEHDVPVGGYPNKNLLIANVSSVETNTTGFVAVDSTMVRSTEQAHHGAASLKLTITPAQASMGGFGPYVAAAGAFSVVPSTAYTWSFWVYASAATKLKSVDIDETGGANRTIAVLGLTDLVAGWNYITLSATTFSDNTPTCDLVLRPARNSADTAWDSDIILYYDQMQVEQGSEATEWVLPGLTTGFWTDAGFGAAASAERVAVDAADGENAWKATVTGGNTYERISPFIPIDGTKLHILQGEFKKLSAGATSTAFLLLCYDSSNALLTTLAPFSIASLNHIDIPTNWTEYGGWVWPIGSGISPALPAGTTKVKVKIRPSWTAAAEVLWDNLSFEQTAPGIASAQGVEAQKWYGYFDGDTQPFASDASYSWTGEAGESESTGLSRLSHTAPIVYAKYTHSLSMDARRLRIDRWVRGREEWRQIYDSGMVLASAASGTVIAVPLPAGVIENEERYRLRVSLRDTNGVSGDGEPAVVDVLYVGPAERNVTGVSANALDATITITHEATELVGGAFAGYQYGREGSGAGGEVVVIGEGSNPEVTQFVDPYPISGEQYTYMVRQGEVSGADTIWGRWSSTIASVDYEPFFFIKDVTDPLNSYAAYHSQASNLPTPEEDAITAVYAFWGQDRPTVLTREGMRLQSGADTAEFYPDSSYPVEDHDTRYEKMRDILYRRPTVCLLRIVPDKERIFASIVGPRQKGWIPYRVRSLSFTWQENNYREDLREREDR